jgi:uncharacterized protein (TIGR02466 family)
MEVYNIFPTIICSEVYEKHSDIKQSFYDFKKECEINVSGTNSNLIHYHSKQHSLLSYSVFSEFKSWCENVCLKYVKEILCYQVDNMLCTDSWMNVSNQNSTQYYHTHTNAFVSATYYINYDKDIHSPLTFVENTTTTHPCISLNTIGSRDINVYPSEGSIVLWPSHLKHGYVDNKGDDRMVVSMNFMPETVKHGPHQYRVVSV